MMQAGYPFVSVIVPIRNEAEHIEQCLSALDAQDYPRSSFEVVVLDGESDDDTRAIVERFCSTSSLNIRLLNNPARRTAPGLNLGIRHAQGTVIVRVDGHSVVAKDFLRSSLAALARSGADCVGGPIQSVGFGFWGRAIATAMSSRFGVGNAAFRVSKREQWTDTVAFAAYRREVFDKLGGFREDLDGGEDDEFNYRLISQGGRILLAPEIQSTYIVRSSLRALARQYFRYGMAKTVVLSAHPQLARFRHLIPPLFALAVAMGTCLVLAGIAGPVIGIAAAYSSANVVATLSLVKRAGWTNALALPVVFTVLHMAYGFGFWIGVFRFRRGQGGERTATGPDSLARNEYLRGQESQRGQRPPAEIARGSGRSRL